MVLHNCYHSQRINNGKQLEQGGFSLKTHSPLSHKKVSPFCQLHLQLLQIFLQFILFFECHLSGGFFCLLSCFLRTKLLNCQSLKRVLADEAEGEMLHTVTPLQVLQTL